MKSSLSRGVFASALLLAFSSASLGQTAVATAVEESPPEVIEEIVVYGDKSLLVLKNEIKRASDVVKVRRADYLQQECAGSASESQFRGVTG